MSAPAHFASCDPRVWVLSAHRNPATCNELQCVTLAGVPCSIKGAYDVCMNVRITNLS
jgi:hypothetical protein